MNKLIDITEKILRIIIEDTPMDYIIGELNNYEPWKGLKKYYNK